MKNYNIVRFISKCVVFCMFFTVILSFTDIPSAKAEAGISLKEKFSELNGSDAKKVQSDNSDDVYYSMIERTYAEKGYKPFNGKDLVIEPKNPSASSEIVIPMKAGIGGNTDNVLVWNEDCKWFEWKIDVPETGLYEMQVEYYALKGTGSAIQRELSIDGKVPFQEAHNITFERLWKDEGEPKVNNIGDEVRPGQVEINEWRITSLTDNRGMYSSPFKFYFTKGVHTIRFENVDEPVALKKIILRAPAKIPSYNEVKAKYETMGYTKATKSIKFQAEKETIYKTSPTLRREYDGDPLTEPVSEGERKLNVMGGSRWRTGGQEITWNIDVEEDGLYRIDMRLSQAFGDGLPVYRQIKLDGEVPFSEMQEYKFRYERGWRMESLSDSLGNPYMFYMKKGKHTLTMKVVMGPITGIVQSLIDNTVLLSEMYRKIIMLTGDNPDPNFEYELDRNIPDLLTNFQILSDSMKEKDLMLTGISEKKPAMASNFKTIKDQLDSMIKKPDSISLNLSDLDNAQTSLGNYILSLQNMPLTIDYFIVSPPEAKMGNVKSNIFQKFAAVCKDFIRSFRKDYDSVGNIHSDGKEKDKVLNVWISRGKEWAELIKELTDEDFSEKTGIYVNMNILPAGQLHAGSVNALMLAINSGNAPDIACGVDSNSPAEFAMRGAAYNLASFKDYPEVANRFYPKVLVPYEYDKGVYALPEQMDFQVMVYRKDILKDLGLSIPNSWEDIYEKLLPVLYQNKMNFHPAGFATFLFQRGGEFYTSDRKKTALDTPEAYMAFKEWNEQYISYGMPAESNFFNRFRRGEMPVGIIGYGDYMKLATAAPELYGRWDIAMVPGHKKSDGTIDRSIGGVAGNCSIILSQTKKKEAAWEFLKWWTGKDTQIQFGKELEALLGSEARWNTANKEAFKGLPWEQEHRKIILEQMEWGKEQPVVPGGYFTGRHVNNAWTRVVTVGQNIRDSLEQAVKDINKELKSKQEEIEIRNRKNAASDK